VTCLGTLLDDKGLMSKSFMSNPEMKPQTDSDTKFKDVKGVDEAKSELEEVNKGETDEELRGPVSTSSYKKTLHQFHSSKTRTLLPLF
jgi:hypothetical protein